MAQRKEPVVDLKQVDDDIYFDSILGDFVFVESDNQHIMDILQSLPGYWKNAPTIGAGLQLLLKSKLNVGLVESTIKVHLEADGYQVERPLVTKNTNGDFTINPKAVRL